MRRATATAAALALLLVPASATAKTATYAGSIDGGGKAALDVRLSKHGRPKEILQGRLRDFFLYCQKSGAITGSADFPFGTDEIKVNREGHFWYRYEQPSSGRVSEINGQFKHKNKKIIGTFSVSARFPADEAYPEEGCSSYKHTYVAKKGAADETRPLVASALRTVGT